MKRPTLLIVTDPMCSWCWGMAEAVDAARAALPEIEFDLLFGGINVDSTQPVGHYGRRQLARLWAEVSVVTGQELADAPCAAPFVYNSAYLCHLLEAARELTGVPPFALLRAMQHAFFARALDLTAPLVHRTAMVDCGLDPDAVIDLARETRIQERTTRGMREARAYGTHALPSVVLDHGQSRRLLAGGYLDAPTLIRTINENLAN